MKPPKRLFPSRLPAPALCVLCLVTQACPTTCDPMDCSPPGSSVHGDSPGKNTGVGCHALLQGIFPTQGLNPDLLHCWKIIYCLNHQGSPRGTQNSIQGAGREGKVKTRRCQPHDLPTLQASEPGKREIGWDWSFYSRLDQDFLITLSAKPTSFVLFCFFKFCTFVLYTKS